MRVAARNAEGEPVSAQHAHGAHDGLVRAAPAPRVGGLFETFHRDGRHEVLHAQQVLGERVVDERGVRERGERAVVVLLAETDEVALAHERLSAAEQVEEHAQFLALRDDGVQLLEREVEPVAILGRPAARTVQVAGARRVDEHGPGHVAPYLAAAASWRRRPSRLAFTRKFSITFWRTPSSTSVHRLFRSTIQLLSGLSMT